MTQKLRADQLLVQRGLFESRAKAQAAIEAGRVRVDRSPVRKPGQLIAVDAFVEAEPAFPYVSRGGVKLAAALEHFAVDVAGRTCLDVGSSTGGFTDALLRNGARRVYAVDVGQGQLHPSLRARGEVISLEHTDVRRLTPEQVPEPCSIVVADVSFISLKLVLPALRPFATEDAVLVALIKPQFEAGRARLRHGIVRDPEAHRAACDGIADFARRRGWSILGVIDSPLQGGDGNREFLMAARRDIS